MLKRLILDTNIYGRIFEMEDYELVISQKRKILVYGSVVVRKELRDTSALETIKYEDRPRKLRILLLGLYDTFTKQENRILKITKIIETSEFHHPVNGGQGGILSVIKNHRDQREDVQIMPLLNLQMVFDTLAEEYFIEYRKKGVLPRKRIINDFLIVACAAIHSLDILVSHDTSTMLSNMAKNAYEKVNARNQLKNPELIPYDNFKEEVKHPYKQPYWRQH